MAESFGADAERYDRARPRYPDALIARIAAESPGPDVLDVGCGTGIAARQLQAVGCRVLGVDVDARMADFARARGLAVEVAAFERWDAVGRTFDAVTAGQTWHWIDPVAGPAKAAEVLRPGGRLAVFWNVFDLDLEVADAFAAVYSRVLPDAPRNPWARAVVDAYAGILGKVAEGIAQTGAFGEPEEWRVGWERTYTRDEWLDQMLTGGDVAHIAPDALDALTTGVGAVIDGLGGSFTMGYTAVAVTAVSAVASH